MLNKLLNLFVHFPFFYQSPLYNFIAEQKVKFLFTFAFILLPLPNYLYKLCIAQM